MAQTIKLKRSATSGAVPTTGSLELGEVAINTYDGKMYIKKNDGTESVVEIGDTSEYLPLTGGTLTGNLSFGDNDKAVFGGSSDLQIYHDGSNSYIREDSVGSLRIQGADLELSNPSEIKWLKGYNNNRVELFYNNSKKLATTSTGIDVTGTATMDGLTVETAQGDISIANSSSSLNFARAGFNYLRATDASGSFSFITGANNYSTQRLNIASNGDISFYNNSGAAKFFWDASAESLGIGTSSPSAKLHLSGDGDSASKLTVQRTGTTAGTAVLGYNYLGSFSDNDFRLFTNSTERMRIDSAGNLLVGTTSGSLYNTTSNTGIQLDGTNANISVARSNNRPMDLNRLGSDGDIVQLRKDGTTVGSVGVVSTDNLYIQGNSSHQGLAFGSSGFVPFKNGAYTDNVCDIGGSTVRFRNLYLSDSARAPIFYDSGNTGNYLDSPTSSVFRLNGSSGFVLSANGSTIVTGNSGGIDVTGGVTASGKITAEDNVSLGGDASYGGYGTLSFSGFTNGHNRIFGGSDTTKGLYLCSAHSIYFRASGSTADHLRVDGSGSSTASGSFRAPIFYDSGNTGNYIDSPTSSVFRLNGSTAVNLAVGGATKLAATSTGVGIGTSSPTYPLHVAGEAGIEIYNASGGGDVLNFRPSLGDANKYNLSISSYDHSGDGVGPADGLSINGFDGVSIATGSSTTRQERMRIDSAGNVIINTGALHVPEYIYHESNTGTYIRYLTNRIITRAGSGAQHDMHSNGNQYFTGKSIFYTGVDVNAGNLEIGATTVIDSSRNLTNIVNVTATGVDHVFGSSSNTNANVYIRATNTAGAPAHTAKLSFEGYEGRGQGTFHTDVSYAGQEWFSGIPYSAGFAAFQIGYDAAGGQAEYGANSIARFTNAGDFQMGTTTVIDSSRNLKNVNSLSFSDTSPTLQEDGNYLRIQTSSGWTSIGSGNSSWTHFFTDRGGFYFGTRVNVNGEIRVYNTSSVINSTGAYAPAFYDSDNTAFYVNPASTSNVKGFIFNSGTTLVQATPNIESLASNNTAGNVHYHATFCRNDGTVNGKITTNYYATTYSTTSDYRVKEDIQPMGSATADLMALNPINFQWVGSDIRTDGFLAHEVAAIVPDAVVGEKDSVDAKGNPDLQGLDQSKMVPLLVKTIQEQQAAIQALEARITALENA